MNKIIVIGHLGRDPEMRYTPNGQAVTSFSVASSRRYTTAAGEQREETEWFNVSAWGKLGETCNQYLTKGQQVYVEGRLSSRSYEARDGTTRFSNDINLTDVQFLGRAGDGGGAGDSAPYRSGVGSMSDEGPMDNDPVDDLPF
ncbi:MAG: single-stranded DNA-binding protein [Chloroflexi bacterium]|nr:single-stranded DNA-binding protein [Chloroflexota bacterium]MDA1270408.1 single-stranded DNA-binding protein [Chloroflexota bacterium]